MNTHFTVSDFQRFIDRISSQPGLLSFFNSSPGYDIAPSDELRHLTSEVMDDYKYQLFQYGSPQGYGRLRQGLAGLFLNDPGKASKMLITSGAQQGLDLVVRLLHQKEKKLAVAFEDPSYIGFRHIADSWDCSSFPVPMEKDGINLISLERVIKINKVKLVYLIPDYHNPTGICLSEDKRKKVIKLCEHYGVYIIEDLSYRYLGLENDKPLPLLSSLSNQAIAIGSLSKMFSPGMRIGWVYNNNEKFINSLILEKRATELFQPYLTQIVTSEFIEGGLFAEHLERIKGILKIKRDYLSREINWWRNYGFNFTLPNGGIYLWIKCPPNINSYKLMESCIQQQVVFGAGRFFSVMEDRDRYFRLSYNSLDITEMREGVHRLNKGLIKVLFTGNHTVSFGSESVNRLDKLTMLLKYYYLTHFSF